MMPAREASRRVLFQPDSAVVHLEGGTAGLDVTAGPKRYQVINQEKFVARWSRALRQQPPRPERMDFSPL